MASISWKMIRRYWQKGDYLQACIRFLNRIPQMTFPLGEESYWSIMCQQDFEFFGRTWMPTWWREICHFVGGFVLTLPFLAWPLFSCFMSAAVFLTVLGREVLDDGLSIKSLVDISAWTLGSFVATGLSIYISIGGSGA